MIISTTSDINYIGYLKCLIKSCVINSPQTKFHVRLVNIPDKDKLKQELSSIKQDIIIEFDDYVISNNNLYTKRHNALLWDGVNSGLDVNPQISEVRHSKWLISAQQCYTSNIRFRNIYNLLRNYTEPVLYLDADSIIVKNLEDFANIIKKHDISIKLRKSPVGTPIPYPNNNSWECSCIGVNNTLESFEFIEDVMINTEKNMFFWDSDQFEFEYSVNRFNNKIKLNLLTENEESCGDMNGNKLTMESYILAGSYKNKILPGIFVNELKKYEQLLI
jgi:hypothetical protein